MTGGGAFDLRRVSGIVLAAGFSRRSSDGNKLLLPWGGGTVVGSVAAAMCGAGFGEVLVVTGFERERMEPALAGFAVRCVGCDDYGGGMGRSLAAGIRAAAADAGGFAICPGDLPWLSAELVRRVAETFAAAEGRCHVVPTAAGQRGHPVFIGPWVRSELESLAGDRGAREILASSRESARCRFVEVGDVAIHADVDAGRPQRDCQEPGRRLRPGV